MPLYQNSIKSFIACSCAVLIFSVANAQKVYSYGKDSMYVYNTEIYTDGAYLNYQSFCKQIPDSNIQIKGDSVSKNTVKTLRINGKFRKTRPGELYAIVYNGKPYIATQFGFFPMQKKNNTFTFVGMINTATTTGIIIAGAALGALGSVIAANESAVYEVEIERATGKYIRVKKIITNDRDYGYYD